MINKSLLHFIQDRIDEIETDPRFKERPASIFSNAPLALIQTELKSRRQTLIAIREIILEDNSNGSPNANSIDPNELPFIDPEKV